MYVYALRFSHTKHTYSWNIKVEVGVRAESYSPVARCRVSARETERAKKGGYLRNTHGRMTALFPTALFCREMEHGKAHPSNIPPRLSIFLGRPTSSVLPQGAKLHTAWSYKAPACIECKGERE